MSLDTYTNLQTALATVLHRSDLTSSIADFITLAEDKLNKRLRIRAMENRVQASVSSEYMALPTQFLAVKNIQVNSSPRQILEYATPEILDIKYPDPTIVNTPKWYTFVGGQIQLAPVPDTTYTVEMDYYKSWSIATDGTNWLLTNAPRCYYYGALMEAAGFLKDDKRIPVWGQMLETAIKEVELADSQDDYPDNSMAVISDSTPFSSR